MSLTALRLGLALIAALFFSLHSNAQELGDKKGWAGAVGGITVPNYNNSSSRLAYGITAGAKLGSEYGLGAYFLHSGKKESGVDFNYELFGIQASYHFEGEAAGAFFGARVGISKVKLGNREISPTNYGVVGGYDHALAESVSLGAEASYMGVAGGDDSGRVDSFGMINFLASLKFWF